VAVEIQDSGIGQNETDLKRIFTPFEQADHSAGRRFQGTGLGLSLTRRLVELHGERVWGASEGAGKGSKFSFVIPVDPRPGNGKER
jgi:signal transduction histidine kinase